MKLFAVQLDKINGIDTPRVELNNKFSELDTEDIAKIHELVSECYKDIMRIYISKKEIVCKN